MAVRHRLAAAACAVALATAGVVTTGAGAAHAESTDGAGSTIAAQVARVEQLLGNANVSSKVEKTAPALDTEWSSLTEAAIDPSQYTCDTTELYNWLAGNAGSDDLMAALAKYDVFDFAEYYAIYYETDGTPQSLGPNGEDTTAITQEVKGLRKFWDFDGSKIQLVGMHGSVLTDPTSMAKIVKLVYGVDDDTAQQVGAIFTDWVSQMPQGADNPYFTFNAFAFDGTSLGLPTKIIVGDGIPAAFDALGLDKVSMKQVIAHEYGHQVQYHDGLTASDLTGPEASRRLELMADALGSYYLTAKKGGTINAKRLISALRVAYDVGDCNYTSDTHHGTPQQRAKAVAWAAQLSASAQPKSQVLSGAAFGSKFDAELPELVAADAS